MNFPIVRAIDLDKDNESDIVQISRPTKYGEKSLASGTDGEQKSKQELLKKKAKDLFIKGHYIEVSGKMADILLNKFNVPFVEDKDKVEKVLDKKIEWVGDGWYIRNIAGDNHKKILVGIPKGI